MHDIEYDEIGRVATITRTGPGAIVPQLLYSYDEGGNLIRVSRKAVADINPVARLRRAYDALGRLTSHIDGSGNRIDYRYDSRGNLTGLTYPDTREVNYDYDAASRLIRVTDWAGRITRYS